jgi:hypothetical protein
MLELKGFFILSGNIYWNVTSLIAWQIDIISEKTFYDHFQLSFFLKA